MALPTLTALLGGCTVGPNYVRPSTKTPAAYKEIGDWKIAQPNDGAQRGHWREIFADARLNALADQINVSNQNVLVAEAKYRQARALVQQALAALFPSVSGTASGMRSEAGAGKGAGVGNAYNLCNRTRIPIVARRP